MQKTRFFAGALYCVMRCKSLNLLFIMKVTSVLLITLLCTIQLLMAAPGFGQGKEQQRISLHYKQVSLITLFEAIEKKANVIIMYENTDAIKRKDISIAVRNKKVADILDQILQNRSLQWSILGQVIRVARADTARKQDTDLAGFPVQPVTQPVSGIIHDQEGNGLSGASVRLQGSSTGTTSDKDGQFTIHANIGDQLIITYVGFQRKTIKVFALKLGVIALEPAETALNAVTINAGYYQTSARTSTGNISKVTAEEIKKQPVLNPLQALQGRMPGVYITQQSGIPGGAFSIQIRGRNSLRSDGNDPLYIIDGVPYPGTSLGSGAAGTILPNANPLNNINPADIESIEILKDADATAIYGSRGANGVILITTKKGTSGKTKVDINLSLGIGQIPQKMKLLNTDQYLEMRYEAFENDGAVPQPWDYDVNGKWEQHRYTDWQEVLIGGTANFTNAQLAVSGGNINTRFLVRGNFDKQTTVFPGNSSFRRGSSHFNLTHATDNKKFRIELTANYTTGHNSLPTVDLTSSAVQLPPNAPALFTNDGNLNWQEGTFNNNPLGELRKEYTAQTDNLVGNVNVQYELFKGFSLKANLGYNTLRSQELRTEPISSYNPSLTVTGSSRFGSGNIKTWIIEPQITYKQTIGKGKLNVLIGTTAQESMQKGEYMIGVGYTTDALLKNLHAAPTLVVVNTNHTQYRYQALFGRINYNWDEKFIINITGRRDGSSRFGSGRRFANFGAAGAAWIFSNTTLIRNGLPFLSFGKLRGSFGTTGSDQIGNYGYLDTYSSVLAYQGSSLVPTRLANPDYSWEVNRKLEVALDLGFIDDRILLSTSWYRNRSSNQLVGESLPLTTGFSNIQNNLDATVENSGWEFSLSSVNFRKDNVTWTTSINVTIPQNTLIAYPGIEASSYRNTWVVGKSLFTTRKVHFIGVDPLTGAYLSEDVNNDGNPVGVDDRQALKKIGQNYFGGIQNRIRLEELEISFFVQIVSQTERNYMYAAFDGAPGMMQNQPDVVMNRWQKPGDDAPIQRFTQMFGDAGLAYYNNRGPFADMTVVNASFVRLQNLSLSWQLPTSWKKAANLQNARIYIHGQNLFTVSDYIGFDPENANSGSLPPLRILTAGIQLIF